MAEDSKQRDDSDDAVLARLTEKFRGASELTDAEAAIVGEAIYAVDAPRAGNDMALYSRLGPWDRSMLERKARAAVTAFLGLMKNAPGIDETAAPPGV